MKNIAGSLKIMLVLLALVIVGIFTGCDNAPLSTPAAPPPPVTAAPTTATSETTITPLSPAPTTNATSSQAAAPASTPVAVTELAVLSNNVTIRFPDEIVFTVTATGPAVIKTADLKYGSDQRSLVPETSTSRAEFVEGKEVAASWTWKMKKTGSIPPGATIWWKWEITDADERNISTETLSAVYADTRFQWEVKEYADFNIYWHDQSDWLINELLEGIQVRLERLELEVTIPPERKPKVFIYTSSEELKDAILFEQEWTGAVAYPLYNVILTAINSEILEWAKDALPHEVTHLLVEEATFGPFGDIPTWLDEGLAQYTQLKIPDYMQTALNTAKNNGTLISINSLSGSFPASGTGAYLAYAESSSIVDFLITQYGWEKMRLLLAVFKEGSTSDKALLEVYSFDVNGLETRWKNYIGAK